MESGRGLRAFGVRWTSAQVTHYDADELLGRLVVGAVNPGATRIAGFRSEFLLLGAVAEPCGARSGSSGG
ncbi:MAG TPA: hypothetical protein VGD71_25910 [Kribbella sp.]